jgi:Zn finger protein HypA/HybF involved in hydrogenase expression/very-short-patch-repair endonuclease
MRKLTKSEFIQISNKRHNNKYDYSVSNYINSQLKVEIICPEHGVFNQIANAHMRGQGCSKCNGGIKYTTSEFVKKATKVHNGFYDYSNCIYIDNFTKLEINCPNHGKFKQLSNNHLSGQGCPKCKGKSLTNEEFIDRCKKIHNNKYDYTETLYTGAINKIKIKCNTHGFFSQKASNHINLKQGCPKCADVLISNTEEFIKKSVEVHGDLYDYKNVFYKNAKTNVEIICKKHGSFYQSPTKHLSMQGCPVCRLSKGELKLMSLLSKYSVDFLTQHKFEDFNLVFDFYIPSKNIAIEYDGIQHFKPIKHFGGQKSFESQKVRDKQKDEYCRRKSICLLRIPYDQDMGKLLKCYIDLNYA